MRVFSYEFVTGGGLCGIDQQPRPAASLLREGEAMWRAIYDDWASATGVEVVTTRDARLAPDEARRVIPVSENVEQQVLRLASESDATLLIAPEFDGILLSHARQLEAKGVRLLSPNSHFIGIATDKTLTNETLAKAGLPVPLGRLLDQEPVPVEFPYPAVLKTNNGAGSMCQVIEGPSAAPQENVMRLERFVDGLPCSVSFLCRGLEPPIACPPMQQILSGDGRLQYLGGKRIMDWNLIRRAMDLGNRALAAMPTTIGYVGIDLVLGRSASGHNDYVIEINPRLTTSYIGLREIADSNLAEAMLQISAGQVPLAKFSARPVHFLADGTLQ